MKIVLIIALIFIFTTGCYRTDSSGSPIITCISGNEYLLDKRLFLGHEIAKLEETGKVCTAEISGELRE